MKKYFALLFAMVMVFSLVACGEKNPEAPADSDAGEPEIVLTFGHVIADGTAGDEEADYLAKLINEKSNGRIKIEVYPNSTLGDAIAELEGLQLGTQDMMITSNAALSSFSDATAVLDLPFLFKDEENAFKVLNGEFGDRVNEKLNEVGFVNLGWFTQGWRVLTCNDEVHLPADISGLKIRVMDSPIHISTWNTLGASAVPMPFSEVFTSLQQHVIDGQENPYSTLDIAGIYEVQNYIIETNHIYDPSAVLISKATWDKLSAEDQQILLDATAEAQEHAAEIVRDMDAATKEKILAGGSCEIIELTADERAAWQEAVQPIWDANAEKIGQDVIDMVVNGQN